MEYGLPSSHTLNTVCLSGYSRVSPYMEPFISQAFSLDERGTALTSNFESCISKQQE